MSSAASTKIFGLRVGLDPKILVVILVGIAALLFWYNSRSDDDVPSSTARPAVSPSVGIPESASVPVQRAPATRGVTARRGAKTSDRATLALRAVDATHGDVDPMLRLDLLARLQGVDQGGNTRNLFQMGAAPLLDAAGNPIKHPIIPPQPLPPTPPAASTAMVVPDVIIPLRYYGFEKPTSQAEDKRGFFLDGDNILVAAEGDVLKQKYMVVELTPTTARIEDIQVKKGKRLPLEPEARNEF